VTDDEFSAELSASEFEEFAPMVRRVDDAFEHAVPAVPPRLSAAARDAFAWRLADQQLAELLDDASDGELVGIRGTSTDRRSFRFAAGEFVIRVHLTEATLIVILEPPLSVGCRVSTEAGTDAHRTDDLGELVIDAPELPMRVELDLPGGTVVTPWITG
jgi:hypothetical protein